MSPVLVWENTTCRVTQSEKHSGNQRLSIKGVGYCLAYPKVLARTFMVKSHAHYPVSRIHIDLQTAVILDVEVVEKVLKA